MIRNMFFDGVPHSQEQLMQTASARSMLAHPRRRAGAASAESWPTRRSRLFL
jgi:hypothetical protein